MKNFTNNNYNANEFQYKDEARVRGISLKGLIVILVVACMIFSYIVDELDFEFRKSKYTILEIEVMAEEYWEDARRFGYGRYERIDYALDKLEDKGIELEKYNIEFDYSGEANVQAK